jgi:hypothetical protein
LIKSLNTNGASTILNFLPGIIGYTMLPVPPELPAGALVVLGLLALIVEKPIYVDISYPI